MKILPSLIRKRPTVFKGIQRTCRELDGSRDYFRMPKLKAQVQLTSPVSTEDQKNTFTGIGPIYSRKKKQFIWSSTNRKRSRDSIGNLYAFRQNIFSSTFKLKAKKPRKTLHSLKKSYSNHKIFYCQKNLAKFFYLLLTAEKKDKKFEKKIEFFFCNRVAKK